jgi:hypothetical protein
MRLSHNMSHKCCGVSLGSQENLLVGVKVDINPLVRIPVRPKMTTIETYLDS